jgi:hypothetical protein
MVEKLMSKQEVNMHLKTTRFFKSMENSKGLTTNINF